MPRCVRHSATSHYVTFTLTHIQICLLYAAVDVIVQPPRTACPYVSEQCYVRYHVYVHSKAPASSYLAALRHYSYMAQKRALRDVMNHTIPQT